MEFEGLPPRRHTPNLTPLIDIVFLLLIFFLLTSHFVKDESLDIVLPEAESATAFEDEDILEIIIDQDGGIIVNERHINPDKLDDILRQSLQGRNKKQVVLRGDQSVPLGLTVKVMDAARKAGAESLDIITRQP